MNPLVFGNDVLNPASTYTCTINSIICDKPGIHAMIHEDDYPPSLDNIAKYEGRWIVVLNDKIVCTGSTLIEAQSAFGNDNGRETPLFDRIPHGSEPAIQIY